MYPGKLKYSKEHHWIELNDSNATLGISYYYQEQLKEVIYVEFPEAGKRININDTIVTIETSKAVVDIPTPLTCEILETNKNLLENPNLIKEDNYGEGWIAKIKVENQAELENFLGSEEYKNFIQSEI
ncbi:MAG: glycine cleavage system protein GcvH [Thermodesulfobacteriota bacterium]|nr:glycine cleavage system protein GcvH [Thermodesulfobacteriota bacterium]